MLLIIILSTTLMVITLLVIFLRRYWVQLRQLQKEHREVCRLIDRMSEEYYNRYKEKFVPSISMLHNGVGGQTDNIAFTNEVSFGSITEG